MQYDIYQHTRKDPLCLDTGRALQGCNNVDHQGSVFETKSFFVTAEAYVITFLATLQCTGGHISPYSKFYVKHFELLHKNYLVYST